MSVGIRSAIACAVIVFAAGLVARGEVVVNWGNSTTLVTASTSLNRYAATSFISESGIGG